MRGTLILFALAGALLLGAKTGAQTLANVTVGWTPSNSTGVSGYYIYYGTNSGQYISAVYVSSPQVTNVTINGLTSGQTYYFAASASDSEGNQSSLSPEISGVAGAAVQLAGALTAVAGLPAGQFGLNVSGLANAQYVVQASTDLVHWVSLQTNLAPFKFVDSNAAQFSRRFYRTFYISN